MKKNDLLSEMINNQLNDVGTKKLQYGDIKRLSTKLSTTIFDENVCSLWSGYITNANKIDKGIYINFYFDGKKAILHRLLYTNFVGPLSKDEYLKFTCENKGKCCNIHHLKKFKYIKKNIDNKKQIINEPIIKNTKYEPNFVVSFK